MFCRIILAALWLGFVFAAGEADARSSGSSGRGASRPAAPAARSLQRFQQAPTPAFNRATQGLNVTPQLHRQSRHRDIRRWGPFVFAAPYGYGNDGFVPPTSYAESDSVPPGAPVIINRRQCFVQPHLVPSEATGMMRTVTVTRCY